MSVAVLSLVLLTTGLKPRQFLGGLNQNLVWPSCRASLSEQFLLLRNSQQPPITTENGSQFMSKLRFLNIFFLKPGLTKKFHFYKGPPILTRWRCLLYARNLQFWLLSSDEFLLRKWFSQKFCKKMPKNMAKPLFDEAAPIFFKIVLKFSGIKQTAPSSENWKDFIK